MVRIIYPCLEGVILNSAELVLGHILRKVSPKRVPHHCQESVSMGHTEKSPPASTNVVSNILASAICL